MSRGGKRTGTPGASYTNRSDMQTGPRPLTPMRLPGQDYGVQAQQVRSQQAVPMGPPPGLSAPPPSQPAPGAPPPSVPAGTLGPLDRPTERPDEPVHAGLPFGPGPGPEVLGQLGQPQTAADLLQSLAQRPGASPDIAFLASYATGGRQ